MNWSCMDSGLWMLCVCAVTEPRSICCNGAVHSSWTSSANCCAYFTYTAFLLIYIKMTVSTGFYKIWSCDLVAYCLHNTVPVFTPSLRWCFLPSRYKFTWNIYLCHWWHAVAWKLAVNLATDWSRALFLCLCIWMNLAGLISQLSGCSFCVFC